MFRKLVTIVLGVFILLLLGVTPSSGQTYADVITVRVMLDFGDGSAYWQVADLDDNRSAIFATVQAAERLGFNIEIQWYSFGVFVEDIGDRNPVWPFWWHFLLWNSSQQDWQLSPLGASDVILTESDVIGWFLASDDPPSPGPMPLATPENPYPFVAFRGDLANRGTTPSQPPASPSLRWTFDFDGSEISASSVAADGHVYQVTWNGTHAIDLNTGGLLWKAEGVAGLSTPALVRTSPVLLPSGQVALVSDLIVGSRDGRLYRLRGNTGDTVWSVLLQEGAQFTGISSSPKVNKGRAVVGTFNETGGKGRLVSVHAGNGTVAWSLETSSIHMSSSAIYDGSIYVGLMGIFNPSQLTWEEPYGLLSVYEDNGTERWFLPTEGPVASSPTIADGVVYFTSRDGYLYGVTLQGLMTFREAIGPSTSSPVVKDGRVYAASGVLGTSGKVAAFALSGQRLWEFSPNGPVQSSLTWASGLLLFATNTEEGTLYALWAENGTTAWTYTPEPAQYILPTPVIVDGTVLIASDSGLLYALVEASLTRPTAAIDSPAEGETLNSTSVMVTGIASDDVEVQRVELSTDGMSWSLATGTASWSGSLELAVGPNTIYARVTDNAGNTNATSIFVTVRPPRQEPGIEYASFVPAGVVVAIILVAAVLYLRRRRRM